MSLAFGVEPCASKSAIPATLAPLARSPGTSRQTFHSDLDGYLEEGGVVPEAFEGPVTILHCWPASSFPRFS